MKRSATSLLALTLLAAPFLHAQEPKQKPDAADAKEEKPLPIPPEAASVTHHEWNAGSRTVHYTATAGNLLLKDDDDKAVNASIFYVAYTEDGAPAHSRPVTFLYNGGPGSASLWLHMGSVGPVRVVTDSPQPTGAAPYSIVPNQYSLLDKTDLVFIDAPLTGFSRAVGKGRQRPTPRDLAKGQSYRTVGLALMGYTTSLHIQL